MIEEVANQMMDIPEGDYDDWESVAFSERPDRSSYAGQSRAATSFETL